MSDHHDNYTPTAGMERLPMGAPDYREADIPYRTLAKWIFGTGIFVIVSMASMRVLYWVPAHRPDGDALIKRPMNQPPLQVRPRENLAAMRAEEKAHLESYGWVDKAKGTVRIPISRAMDLYLERQTKGTGK